MSMSTLKVSNEVLYDFSPLLKQYKDGRIERLIGQEFVPPSTDPQTGVQSKDVEISSKHNLKARIYLPQNAEPHRKIPLLVYVHGGAFMTYSAFHPMYQKHLNYLVSKSEVVAVSVNYRLAPEHALPAAYEDSWLVLKWAVSQFTKNDQNSEEWIKKYADFNRVFLGGDSAGANIAHQMAIRVGLEKSDAFKFKLRGIFLNCSFFWGKDPIGGEVDFLEKPNLFYPNDVWRYVCPTSTGCDDPWINPGTDPNISSLGCGRVLVYVAEKDFFRDRGWYYKEVLEKSGWGGEVEVVEVKGEDHCFSVLYPDSENGLAVIKRVASFLNQ